MHHYIPINPFKVTVRISPSKELIHTLLPVAQQVTEKDIVINSPASFPATPFSRIDIMNKTIEKADSIMFAARDKLRLV